MREIEIKRKIEFLQMRKKKNNDDDKIIKDIYSKKEEKNLIINKNYNLTNHKIIILFLLLIEYLINKNIIRYIKIEDNKGKSRNIIKTKYNYEHSQFAILQRKCSLCGLFSFYIYFLGCTNKYINKGYIPVIDLKSYSNPYNKNSTSCTINPWEVFFEQPFGYSLKETLKYAKNLNYFECGQRLYRPNELTIYYNKALIDLWHDISKKYIPIKKEIIDEANILMKNLFINSNNILGVKIRGTDHYKLRPKYHPIPPRLGVVVSDVKKMLIKYKYDWIFIASEDERIKEKLIKEFGGKIKYLNPKKKINFNFNGKKYFIEHKDVYGNIEYAKNYLMNIYILSKCRDIIMSRGSGGTGIIILTEGFRNSLIYNLGEY